VFPVSNLNPPPNLSLTNYGGLGAVFRALIVASDLLQDLLHEQETAECGRVEFRERGDPSAPVLNQPTGPKPPVESRRLSPVQHKRGREFEGGALISAGGAVPSPSFEEDEISRLAEFFLLLDAWDRRRNGSPVM
jgi:hypothetical protein